MDVAYTSTKSINDGNRFNILRLQDRLRVAQQEVASGRLADVGETLGGRTAETVSLRQQFSRLTTLIETNSLAETRLDSAQSALNDIRTVGEDFVNAVITAKTAQGGPGVAQQTAQSSLVSLIQGLNTSVAGEYLFAGINTSEKPVADYYSDPASAASLAVEAAFVGAFGTTQSDPSNDNITPAAMETFLDTTFAGLFDPPGWTADWSTASDQNIVSRISQSGEVTTSANANESPFRKLAQAYTMVADLGVETLNDGTFDLIADKAVTLASEALQELTAVQSRLGSAADETAAAKDRMRAQRDVLTTQINNLENVDPFEASTRVTTLLTQLETAYALTARVQRLTILNYL